MLLLYVIIFVLRWTMIAYGGVGALIFSLYIVYDTQLMLGGKHKVYYYNMYFILVATSKSLKDMED